MTISRDEALRNFIKYKDDRWAFLTECCFTRDQVDQKQPIKPFPKDWDYLRLYVRLWERDKKIAVPKSRRMTMSWTNICLYLHDALFFQSQDFAFVSKKEEDAAELVRRAEFVYDNIPENNIPKWLLPAKETKNKPPQLSFNNQSKIQGFPMGADQLRQFTFSGILGDECAFWEEAQSFYSASYPTLEGGGKMTLISSRSPGFFQKLCYDQLDALGEIDENFCKDRESRPLGNDSVITWRNRNNGFRVIDIHYTANPKKAAEGYIDEVRKSMPIKDFMVEYERNWEAFDGKPVFEDFNSQRHETQSPLEPHLGLPLLCGWDFGLTPACIVAQLRGQTLYVIKEYVAAHASIEKFSQEVMTSLRQHFPQWNDAKRDFVHYIDPAGLQEAQTDSRTCAGVMHTNGIRNIFPGPLNWESRRKAVEHFLIRQTKDSACFQMHSKDCPKLHRGFKGGYRYPEKYQMIEPGKPSPIKNEYSHPHDALQYLCGGALNLINKKPMREIPLPDYAFLHKNNDGPAKKADEREKEGYKFK